MFLFHGLLLCHFIFYRPQRSWAKVMILQASVILLTGVSTSMHAGIPHPLGRRHPPVRRPPRRRHPREGDPPEGGTPWKEAPPGKETPRHTVNERPVRILLECILVFLVFETIDSLNVKKVLHPTSQRPNLPGYFKNLNFVHKMVSQTIEVFTINTILSKLVSKAFSSILKRVIYSGTRCHDHWFKSLMYSLLS